MTPACMNYIQSALERFPCSGPVLEVGSYNVNGSVRELFADRERFPTYLGIDIRPGPGVDMVDSAATLRRGPRSFGIIVSTEMLEHDPCFWVSVQAMHTLLSQNGYCLLTTRNIGFKRHDYPSDYFRFTADGLGMAMRWAGFHILEAVDDLEDQGTFAVGQKCP